MSCNREIPCKIFPDFPKTALSVSEALYASFARLSDKVEVSEADVREFDEVDAMFRQQNAENAILSGPLRKRIEETRTAQQMEVDTPTPDREMKKAADNIFSTPRPTGRIRQQQEAAKKNWGSLLSNAESGPAQIPFDQRHHIEALGKQLQDVSRQKFLSMWIAVHNVPMPSAYDPGRKFGAEVSDEDFAENVKTIQDNFRAFAAQFSNEVVSFDLDELSGRLGNKKAMVGKGTGCGAILIKLSRMVEFGGEGAVMERMPVCCLLSGSPKVIPPSEGYSRAKEYDRSFMVEGLEIQDQKALRNGKLIAVFRGGPALSALGGAYRLAVQQLANSLLEAREGELAVLMSPMYIPSPGGIKARPKQEYVVQVFINACGEEARRRALEIRAKNRISKKGEPMAWQVGPFRLESSADIEDHRGLMVCTPLMEAPGVVTEVSLLDEMDGYSQGMKILKAQPMDVVRAIAGVMLIPSYFDAETNCTMPVRLAVAWSGATHRDLTIPDGDECEATERDRLVGTEAF
jgi:hypothetical protein